LSATEKSGDPVRREPEISDGAYCAVVRTIFGAHTALYHTEEIVALCYDADG
jgi:hypothetical protein